MWGECPTIPDVVNESVSIMDTKQPHDINEGCKYLPKKPWRYFLCECNFLFNIKILTGGTDFRAPKYRNAPYLTYHPGLNQYVIPSALLAIQYTLRLVYINISM